jgi:20S proteasome alpha/beta subunit
MSNRISMEYYNGQVEKPLRLTEKEIIEKQFKNEQMTLCIGCMANNGRGLVLAADNATTQYLTHIATEVAGAKKIFNVSNGVFVMIAGAPGTSQVIIRDAEIKQNDTLHTVIDKMKTSIIKYNYKLKESVVLIPIGLDWGSYSKMQEKQQFVSDTTEKLRNCNCSSHFAIAGYDEYTSSYALFFVNQDGTVYEKSFDGEVIIGAPDAHGVAQKSLIKNKYNPSMALDEVVKIVTKTMEIVSYVEGVGDLGDFYILPEIENK